MLQGKRILISEKLYNKKFYSGHNRTFTDPMQEALRLVLTINPNIASCVDVGCGAGTWLKAASDCGIKDIYGIDGPWVPLDHLLIPNSLFLQCNFVESWPIIKRRFDLAISLEVAEHLPQDRADDFITFLSSLSDFILFSAAIPGQGGVNHVNEQWPEYWAEKFRAKNYIVLDALRHDLLKIENLPIWYQQNIFIAISKNIYDKINTDGVKTCIDKFVHPDLFLIKCKEIRDLNWKHSWRGITERSLREIRRIIKKLTGIFS